MRQLPITLAAIFIITLVSCDAVEDFFAPVDPLIDQEVVESQDFNLTTPFYGMQVAIDSGVDAGTERVLDLLDNRAEQFLNCQFGDSQIGFEDFMLDSGTVVPPLSELMVYVVPNRFECEAVGRDVCGGIYFSDIDAIVISEGGFEGCGEFSVWKHELAHRYGMEADHSNQSDFNACINTDGCDPGDIFD
ncbi:MAG: hypothetical protein ACREOP_13450 [Thermodesulfobacteriota bacterium]